MQVDSREGKARGASESLEIATICDLIGQGQLLAVDLRKSFNLLRRAKTQPAPVPERSERPADEVSSLSHTAGECSHVFLQVEEHKIRLRV